MRTTMAFAVAALLSGSALAAPVSAPVTPLAYTMRTLPNGLRVFAMPDATTASVAVEVVYDVGAKNDPAGRSGFAHMFEHLMFKSTRDMVPEQLDRLTEDVGGNNNASTHDDFTEYHETVPANHLEPILWAEAQRMGSLVVEPTVFASERNVVEEELRQGEARPYGKLFQTYLPAISYSVHPYARSPIGSIVDLDAATIDDIRAFHAVYYRPDNAVLIVAGNFQPAELDRWVDKYFAALPTPKRAIPRVTTVEPPRTAATTRTVYAPNTPLPAVAISWAIPPSRSPDDAALGVLDAILSAGESSRLYEALVYRDQLASSAGANLDDRQDIGVFAVYAIMAGGKSVADGEAALRREVGRLRDAPPTAAELDVAKNQLLTSVIKGRETPLGRANALAQAVIVDGDPASADRSLADLAAVTAADVQRVARKYLAESASAAIRYLPAESAKGATGDIVAVAATVRPAALTVPPGVTVVVPATAAQRIAPPAPAAPVPVPVPVVAERTLPNGLRVAVATRRNVPLIAAVLVTGGGAATDPAGRGGTAELAATLMTKGTATRSATEIAQQIEGLGGSIGAGAGWDGTTLSMSVKTDRIGAAMAIFADVALHPKFAPEEIERARTQAIDDAGIAMTSPPSLARMVATKAVFGDTTYGHVASGTIKSLKAITRADITAAYAIGATPTGSTLIFTGDIDLDGAVALAAKAFGDWRDVPVFLPPARASTTYPAPRTIVVDLPGAAQASVVVARPGLRRADPAYYPAVVANAALGGGFSSRLNMEIRVKRGLAYGANSGIDARRGIGSLTASTATKNTTAPEVAGLIAAELRKMGSEPVPLPELKVQQAVLNGGFGRSVETVAGLAGRLAGLAIDGLPLAELANYSTAVNAVTPGTITATAATLFDPARTSTIIVGDAKVFLPAMEKAGLKADVIPASALDLDAVTLRK